jgi:hypothetical protein
MYFVHVDTLDQLHAINQRQQYELTEQHSLQRQQLRHLQLAQEAEHQQRINVLAQENIHLLTNSSANTSYFNSVNALSYTKRRRRYVLQSTSTSTYDPYAPTISQNAKLSQASGNCEQHQPHSLQPQQQRPAQSSQSPPQQQQQQQQLQDIDADNRSESDSAQAQEASFPQHSRVLGTYF